MQHAVYKAIVYSQHAPDATYVIISKCCCRDFHMGPIPRQVFLVLHDEFLLLFILRFICIELITINSISVEKEIKTKDNQLHLLQMNVSSVAGLWRVRL